MNSTRSTPAGVSPSSAHADPSMASAATRVAGLAAAALLLSIPAGMAVAQTASPDSVDRGRQLYMTHGCYSCHGTVGQGGERSGAPKLAPDPYPFEAFRALVRTPREAMPRLDPRHVDDAQLQSIHRYLQSIPPSPAVRDIPVLQAAQR